MLLAAGIIWVERRLLGVFQERYGPNRAGPFGVLQVVADMLKIFTKENWIPPFADKAVFVIAPAIIMITTLASFAVIPIAPAILVSDLDIGLLFFLAMSSFAVYSVALAGWASNNKYSASWAASGPSGQMVSYEVFMGLSLMGVVVQAGSFSLKDIVAAQRGLWFVVPQFVGFVVFFIAGLAETRRIPFDLPEAESELVAGYHTEYSGFKFAMFYVGEYIGITLISMMIVTLFFGGWQGPVLPPIVWFLLKTGIFLVPVHPGARGSPAAPLRPASCLRVEAHASALACEPRGDRRRRAGSRSIGRRPAGSGSRSAPEGVLCHVEHPEDPLGHFPSRFPQESDGALSREEAHASRALARADRPHPRPGR